MNIQQLKYFLDAAKTLNFTRTAEKFYISQSAITQQIRNLERELDIKLFRRENHKLYLTEAGEIFVGEARALIERTREAIEKVQSVKKGYTGQLRIGYLQAVELGALPKTIQNFHAKYPGIKLSLERLHEHTLYDAYLEGRFDLIFNIVRETYVYPDTREIPLSRYGFSVAMPRGHRLAGRKRICQKDLTEEALILHDCNLSGGMDQKWISWQAISPELYDNVVSVETDTDTALMLVAAGIGIAVLPDFDLGYKNRNFDIVYVPLDAGGHEAGISMYYRKDNRNPALPLYLEECREVDQG